MKSPNILLAKSKSVGGAVSLVAKIAGHGLPCMQQFKKSLVFFRIKDVFYVSIGLVQISGIHVLV